MQSRYVEPATDEYWDADEDPHPMLTIPHTPDLSSFSPPSHHEDSDDDDEQLHSPDLSYHHFVKPSSSTLTSPAPYQPFSQFHRRSSDDLDLRTHNLQFSPPPPPQNPTTPISPSTPDQTYYDSDPETTNHTLYDSDSDTSPTNQLYTPENAHETNLTTPSSQSPSPIPKLNYFVHDGFRYDGDIYELRHPDERSTQSRPERALPHKPPFLNNRQAFTRVYSEATFHTRPASLRFSRLSRLSSGSSWIHGGLCTPTGEEMSFLSDFLGKHEMGKGGKNGRDNGDDGKKRLSGSAVAMAQVAFAKSVKKNGANSSSGLLSPASSPKILRKVNNHGGVTGNEGVVVVKKKKKTGNDNNHLLPKPLQAFVDDDVEEEKSSDRIVQRADPKAVKRLHYDKAAMMTYAKKARSSAGRRAAVVKTNSNTGADVGGKSVVGKKPGKITTTTTAATPGLGLAGKGSLWSAVSSSGTVLQTGDPRLDAELKLSSGKGNIMQRRMYAAAAAAGGGKGVGVVPSTRVKGREENMMGHGNQMRPRSRTIASGENNRKVKGVKEKGMRSSGGLASSIGAFASGAKRKASKKAGPGNSKRIEAGSAGELPPGSKRRWKAFRFGKRKS